MEQQKNNGIADESKSIQSDDQQILSAVGTRIPYRIGAIAMHGVGASLADDNSANPRRGDLVTFMKARNSNGVRDIRITSRASATLVRGNLQNIDLTTNTATFVSVTEIVNSVPSPKEKEYEINLEEVISCDPKVLKANEVVEGILHEGKIHGICRSADLYLKSAIKSAVKGGKLSKERPKLNLTVKRNKGGKIMAQSMMAKGPDGTNGFHAGWTNRVSKFVGVLDAQTTDTNNGSNENDSTHEAESEIQFDSASGVVTEIDQA